MNTRIKRGTIREDGKIFWCYHNKGKEYWVTPDVFENNQSRNGKWARENAVQNRKNAKKWNRANRKRYNSNKSRSAKNNPEATKNAQLRIKFNINLEQYNKIFYLQNHKCAICKDECLTGRQLAVDHDHKTGKVRGLLCMECNIGLGKFKDSTDRLMKAIKYIVKNSVDTI
jgi:hypothetical protein